MQAVVGSALLVGIKGFSVWGCGVELGGGGVEPDWDGSNKYLGPTGLRVFEDLP